MHATLERNFALFGQRAQANRLPALLDHFFYKSFQANFTTIAPTVFPSFLACFHLNWLFICISVSLLVSFRFDSTRFALIVLLPSGGEFTQFRETVNNLAPEEGAELVELIKCFTYFTSTTTRKTFRCGLYANFCFIFFLLPLNQFRTPSIVTPNRRLSFRFLAKASYGILRLSNESSL